VAIYKNTPFCLVLQLKSIKRKKREKKKKRNVEDLTVEEPGISGPSGQMCSR
jgi:hypothetical protein